MRTDVVPPAYSRAVPPHIYFLVSAVFHYLGPSFAVLLFAHLGVLGVAGLRIISAAIVFAAWRRPWWFFRSLPSRDRWVLVALGVVLGLMNSCFYLAIARLPLATVGAIEFIGPHRTRRHRPADNVQPSRLDARGCRGLSPHHGSRVSCLVSYSHSQTACCSPSTSFSHIESPSEARELGSMGWGPRC